MYTRNIFIAVVLVLSVNSASARPWFAHPSISLSAGYDNNPTLEVDPEEVDPDSNITDIELDPEAVSESDQFEDIDNQSFGLIGGDVRIGSETGSDLIAFDFAAIARRFNASELDSEYLKASALYKATGMNHDYGFEAGVTTDSTLETELEDTGRLEENLDRDAVYVQSDLKSRFSPKLIGDFSLSHREVSFDGGTGTFIDYKELTASAKLNRIISERLSTFGLLEYLRYRPMNEIQLGDNKEDDFTGIQIGFNYNLTEPLALSLSAGRGFTETEQLGEEESVSISENNTIYNVGLSYTGDRNSLDANYSRTFESSADGGLSQNESFSIGVIRPETLGGTFRLQASYITRDPIQGEADPETRDYYAITPSIVWQLNQNLSLSTQLQYREQETTDTNLDLTDHADATSVLVGMRYDFGRKRISY